MSDGSPILPLLSPQSYTARRAGQRAWPFHRFLFRRKLKFYLCALALTVIFTVTIIHRNTIRTKHDEAKINAKIADNARYEVRTLRTIVGRYVGPAPDWATNQTVSDELINSNNYDPDPSMGRDGRPVYLDGVSKEYIQTMYKINRFNLVASDKISVDRKLPDPRKTACRGHKFDLNRLLNTSVIIVFHNEAWSTLARTVHSILNTSPHQLLAEILLVDDASNRTFLGKSLDYYMNNLSSMRGVDIRVIRSASRVGLIKARLLGVEQAKGRVLTFIDAHCEATEGWLEPLLEQVSLDRKTAACPIIDIINEENFAFTRSFELHLGAFNWGLNFRWYPISKRELINSNGSKQDDKRIKLTELIHPFRTPIMAGGLFSIDRDYFNEIGKYDPHMDIWGGENIELSLRLWQCGGQVRIVPCSHVAHIFRKSSPYSFRPGKEVGDILYSNLARVAEVWMDGWRNFFFLINPIVNRTLTKVGRETVLVDIDSRKQLRRDLNCKSFDWFLENIWPEHFFPHPDRFFGKVEQEASGKCLQRPIVRGGSNQVPVGAVDVAKCSGKFMTHQLFVFNSKTGFLQSDENVCLDSGSDPVPSRQVILAPCSESKRQKWQHTNESQLRHIQSNLCLDASDSRARVRLETCDTSLASQHWKFRSENWH